MPENSPRERMYRFGDFLLVADGPLLLRDGVRVAVTPRVLNVLLVLVENAGRVVTKETLLNKVWADSFVEEGNLNRTVSRLRQSLGESFGDNRYIETIPRVGYRFIADVELVADAPAPPASAEEDEAAAAVAESVGGSDNRIVRGSGPIRLGAAIGVVGLVIVAGVAIWIARSPSPVPINQPIKKQEAVRLTDNPSREDRPNFTKDGKIRFSRWQGNQAEAFVMEADGSNSIAILLFPV